MSQNHQYYYSLFKKYRSKGILIDSNLLLLFFIGSYKKELIDKFSRTKRFSIRDFDFISNIIKSFDKVVTTPNILTEVSNLSNKLNDDYKNDYFSTFEKLVKNFIEEYFDSDTICQTDHFKKFGLSDAVIVEQARKEYLVLTMDAALADYLGRQEIDAINYNHIRPLNISIFP